MKQETLIDELPPEESQEEKNPFRCKFHRWANRPDDFTEETIKKTGEIVIRCKSCLREKRQMKEIRSSDWQREKEELTDYYIRRTFVTGTKNALEMSEYPQELVDAKRAAIQLKRATKLASEPLKKCAKHGNLYRDDVIKSGKSRWTGEVQWKCRQCMKEMHKKHYELHKVKVKLKHADYRDKNRNKLAITKRLSRDRNRLKYMRSTTIADSAFRHTMEMQKAKKMTRDKIEVDNLTDKYVTRKIIYKSGLKPEDVPQELIEAKRAILLLKRGIRKKRDEEIFNLLEEERNGKD